MVQTHRCRGAWCWTEPPMFSHFLVTTLNVIDQRSKGRDLCLRVRPEICFWSNVPPWSNVILAKNATCPNTDEHTFAMQKPEESIALWWPQLWRQTNAADSQVVPSNIQVTWSLDPFHLEEQWPSVCACGLCSLAQVFHHSENVHLYTYGKFQNLRRLCTAYWRFSYVNSQRGDDLHKKVKLCTQHK